MRGRVLAERDRPRSERVAVVNEALVHKYFAHREPIGEQIRVGEEPEWLTIVGAVGNERRPDVMKEMSLGEQPIVYSALTQNPRSFLGCRSYSR